MASVFEVQAKLEADASNFTRGMKQAEGATDKLERATDNFADEAKRAQKASKNLSGGGGLGAIKKAAAVAGAALAAVGVQQFVKGAIDAASAAQEVTSAVGEVFGEASGTIEKFAEDAAMTMGQTSTQFQNAAKTFGIFGQSAGLAAEDNAQFSAELTELASDMASFNDTTVDQALSALGSALQGQSEPMRKYGVLLSQAELEAKAMEMGINDGNGALTAQQKVLATHAAIMDQTATQQGDFARTQDGLANSQRTLTAVFGDFQEQIGTALLPVVTELTNAMIPLVEELTPVLTTVLEALAPVIQMVTDNLQPLVEAFMPLLESLTPIMEAFAQLAGSLLPPVIEVVGFLAGVFAELMDVLMPLITNTIVPLIDMLTPLISQFTTIAEQVMPYVINMITLAAEIFDVLMQVLTPIIEAALPLLMDILNDLAPAFDVLTWWSGMLLDAFRAFGDWIDQYMPAIEQTISSVFGGISDVINDLMKNFLGPLFNAFKDFLIMLGVDIPDLKPKVDYSGMEFPEKTITAGMEREQQRLEAMQPEFEDKGFEIGKDFALGMAGGIDSAAGAVGDAAMEALGPIKQLFADFNEDIKKQQARITLQGLGLSDALVEEVLGSGEQWEEAYNTIVKGGEQAAQSLQSLFNQTTDGIAEIEEATAKLEAELEKQRKALEEFNRKAEEYQQDISSLFEAFIPLPTIEKQIGRFESQVIQMFANIDETIRRGVEDGLIGEAFESQLRQLSDSYKKQLEEIAIARDELDKELEGLRSIEDSADGFRDGIDDMLSATAPLQRVAPIIGRFEQAVTESFDTIADKVQSGIDIGLITEDIADRIQASSNTVQSQLTNLARQRDDLATEYEDFVARLEDAKAFRDATRDAQIGFANINQIGRSATRMTRNLAKIVENTTKYRDDLMALQEMGLSDTAYRQILESGMDVGSATAEALLRGGQDAINEVNTLYGDLESVSSSLADNATDKLYDGGVDQIQGLIDGIVAQDDVLRREAENIATAFTDEFQGYVDTAYIDLDNMIQSIIDQQAELERAARETAESFNKEFSSTVSQAVSASRPVIDPQIDEEAAAKLQNLIAGADRYIGNIEDAANRAGGQTKRDIYQVTLEKVLEGEQVDVSGFVSGLKSTELTDIAKTTGISIPGAATGGLITGIGTGISDSIPMMLSNGEYVMNSGAVSRYGVGTMESINSGKLQTGNTINITVNAGMGADGRQIGKQVVKAIREYERTSGSVLLRS